MKKRLLHSFKASLEWRLIAFVITNAFLWATSGEFWSATKLAIELQLILLAVSSVWFFFRHSQHTLVPISESESSQVV